MLNTTLSKMVNVDNYQLPSGAKAEANNWKKHPVTNSNTLTNLVVYNVFNNVLEKGLAGTLKIGKDADRHEFTEVLTPSCPLSIRGCIMAQSHAKVKKYAVDEDGKPLDDGGYIRMSTLYNGTIGSAFTLVARVIRFVFRTIFAPFSLAIATYQQARYGSYMPEDKKYNIVFEDLRRIGWEWVDLGTTLLNIPIALINTLAPNAISTDFLTDYYVRRGDEAYERNQTYREAKKAYWAKQEEIHQAFETAKIG